MKNTSIISRLKAALNNSIIRWWIVGLFFTVASIPLIKFLDEWLYIPTWLAALLGSARSDRMPHWLALALASQIITIVRFFFNDRWVFGHIFPTWKRLWQYQVANIGSFVLWFAVSAYLTYEYGMNTTWAGFIGTIFSVGFSVFTNFLWIWKKPKHKKTGPSAQKKKTKTSQQ